MKDYLNDILGKIKEELEPLVQEGLCIAFSGGVDSSLLLKIACDLGKKHHKQVMAVTFHTHLHPMNDLSIAQTVAEETGAKHKVIQVNELKQVDILNNPVDRCYICKKYLFQTLVDFCTEEKIPHIVEGTNFDDLSVYRPGLKALKELKIKSPLAKCQVSKARVRELAQSLGLSVSNRPSAPCLATRLPYNSPLNMEVLRRIEEGEEFIKNLGFPVVRLRLHGEIVRLEVPFDVMPKMLTHSTEITNYLKNLGFHYVTLDLEGFRSGSMDIYLEGEGNS